MGELGTIEGRFDVARKSLLFELQFGNDKIIYVDGWNSLGAVPLLRSIAQELQSTKAHPPKLCFDKIIYLDCSLWESRRMMQRKIAEELKLDQKTMKVFDTQDEEDDFNGVDRSSRDVIQSVAVLIHHTLVYSRFIMIFINGSGAELDVTSFGIPVAKYLSGTLMWTFNRRLLTIDDSHREIQNKIRGIQNFVHYIIRRISSSEFSALVHEEIASIVARHPCMHAVDLTMVTDCCLYELFLHYISHITTGFDWTAHAPNYWMCAGIIERDATSSEIVNALQKEICWKCDGPLLQELLHKFMGDPKLPFFVLNSWSGGRTEPKNYQIRPYDWVCITSEYLTVPEKVMETILKRPSSLFVVCERSNDPPPGLPNGLFKHCSNLAVLTLSCCAFSFVSPPFLVCQTIKFLGLEHCTDNKAREENYSTNWVHLHSLWVLDLRNTDWDDILSEEKLEIMDNLTELNIEGDKCWEYLSQLQNRLPCLERLRIIKPTHEAAGPTDTRDSFKDKKMLRILDLSGNKDMKDLPGSITDASNLEVLVLDGCDELENVVLDSEFHSSLRSFSFDGYGPTTQWKSMVDLPPECSRPKRPSDANKVDVKTVKISLRGFKQLDLFLRGLPNLEELDLSGSTIKVLDFNTMVVDVPNLKRLFLLGCEHLRAIIQEGEALKRQPKLELLCIDTRPGWSTGCARPYFDKHKSFQLQVHANIVEARLLRSLISLIESVKQNRLPCWGWYTDVYFNIRVTMSGVCGDFIQQEATSKEMARPRDQRNVVAANRYVDVCKKIGDVPSSMEAFPKPQEPQSDRHIEIGDRSHIMESSMEASYGGTSTMARITESLNVHDSSNISRLPGALWECLRWCCMARCPNLDTIFSTGSLRWSEHLETIWASDLPKARCIWDGDWDGINFSFGKKLQHLHLCSCLRLQFLLPIRESSFPNLKTLYLIHCGDLGHAFVVDKKFQAKIPIYGVPFPKLTTIHLYDLPKLRQISECRMLAPALEIIRIRACFGLRRLPSLDGREPGMKRPVVEMEKDVWNALEWDGPAASHDPSLFEPPVHSRYYRRRLLKGTVLR